MTPIEESQAVLPKYLRIRTRPMARNDKNESWYSMRHEGIHARVLTVARRKQSGDISGGYICRSPSDRAVSHHRA